jgi:hypothetical protein
MVTPTVRKCASWRVNWMKKQKTTNSLKIPQPKVTISDKKLPFLLSEICKIAFW